MSDGEAREEGTLRNDIRLMLIEELSRAMSRSEKPKGPKWNADGTPQFGSNSLEWLERKLKELGEEEDELCKRLTELDNAIHHVDARLKYVGDERRKTYACWQQARAAKTLEDLAAGKAVAEVQEGDE
jgi:hypothetical protein